MGVLVANKKNAPFSGGLDTVSLVCVEQAWPLTWPLSSALFRSWEVGAWNGRSPKVEGELLNVACGGREHG